MRCVSSVVCVSDTASVQLAKQCAVEKALDFSECNFRPATGSLHHPVAEAATSNFDVPKRGAFS